MVRSILAILAGLVTLTVISFGIEALADPILRHLLSDSLPADAPLNQNLTARVIMLVYGTFSVAAGGFVSAWVVRRRPLRHAAILGVVQSIMTLLAMISLWQHAPAATWILTLVMTLPACLIGGWICSRMAGSTRVEATTVSP